MPPVLSRLSLEDRQPKRKENIMGLDMFAYVTSEVLTEPVDFEVGTYSELHYWRKHPNLHGWMEKLYSKKGGSADSFNCVNVALDIDDLDRLEADIRARSLPQTSGFFFGESDGSEMEEDLTFIRKARAAVAEGQAVYYTSWW
jgi:hypothetical protein